MAMAVRCHHCSSVLDLDDGFRGGVCRCHKCGTLLRVPGDPDSLRDSPVRKKRPAEPGAAEPNVSRPRSSVEVPGLSRKTLSADSSQSSRSAETPRGSPQSGRDLSSRARPSAPPKSPIISGSTRGELPRPTVGDGARTAKMNKILVWIFIAVAALLILVVGLIIFAAFAHRP